MNQQPPDPTTGELEVNIEEFFGLSDWASGSPPFIGWWKTRRTTNPNLYQPQRRWWDGVRWSVPCLTKNPDTLAVVIQQTPTHVDDVEWCGLKFPHPAGYSYEFGPSDRTKLHQLKRR